MRQDISDDLIHFTRATADRSASATLFDIARGGWLRASSFLIKGDYRCVCFTEAPVESLRPAFLEEGTHGRYEPFGIMVSKAWLWQRGGRPVIYQPDIDFTLLDETLRWRHMRLELPGIDFTWEREWRVREGLQFDEADIRLVVPSPLEIEHMIQLWDGAERDRSAVYEGLMEELELQQRRRPCPWRFVALQP